MTIGVTCDSGGSRCLQVGAAAVSCTPATPSKPCFPLLRACMANDDVYTFVFSVYGLPSSDFAGRQCSILDTIIHWSVLLSGRSCVWSSTRPGGGHDGGFSTARFAPTDAKVRGRSTDGKGWLKNSSAQGWIASKGFCLCGVSVSLSALSTEETKLTYRYEAFRCAPRLHAFSRICVRPRSATPRHAYLAWLLEAYTAGG